MTSAADQQPRIYFPPDFDTFTMKGFPFIMGRPNIQPFPFGSLCPGDLITKIGLPGRNGSETTSHRIDEWTPWIKYAGFVFVESWTPDEISKKCLAFLLPPGGIVYDGSHEPASPVYCLYVQSISGYILRPNFKSNVCRQYSAAFTTVDNRLIVNL